MIYSAIYKVKISKETKRLYNLGGKELIDLQEKNIKVISRMLGRWYQQVLEDLANNTEVKYNDLFVDQKQFITKDISNKDFEEYSKMLTDGFNIGAKQLNKSFKKDIRITGTFGVDPADALKYANEFAGSKIKGIDDYSKKKINDLVSQGLEKGWWYMKLANELKRDFAFSDYRARLIASQEIGDAYLNGKDRQFARYTNNYGQRGWKKWVSHRDDKTTPECLANDDQGWIHYDQEFKSGHMKPLRHVWCRCNTVYRLFDPRDNGENITAENATDVDKEQSYIPEDGQWDDGMKPDNYDQYSSKILPARYFNAIGFKANYIEPKGRAYYMRRGDKVNLGEKASWATTYKHQVVEAHEVWHMFFTRVVMPDDQKFGVFKGIFKDSVDEVKELIKDKDLRALFHPTSHIGKIAKSILDKYRDLDAVTAYKITESVKEVAGRQYTHIATSEELTQDIAWFMDTLGALTKEATVGWGHGKSYYKNSMGLFRHGQARITENQAQEYFAHLNETFWVGNPLIEKFLPKTHRAMKDFYTNIWHDFIQ